MSSYNCSNGYHLECTFLSFFNYKSVSIVQWIIFQLFRTTALHCITKQDALTQLDVTNHTPPDITDLDADGLERISITENEVDDHIKRKLYLIINLNWSPTIQQLIGSYVPWSNFIRVSAVIEFRTSSFQHLYKWYSWEHIQ